MGLGKGTTLVTWVGRHFLATALEGQMEMKMIGESPFWEWKGWVAITYEQHSEKCLNLMAGSPEGV